MNHFLWIFTTNKTLGLIEILLGGLGILMCFRQQSVIYCTLIGWITLGTGTARFVPAADPITIDFLNINYSSAYLFIGIGGCALFSAFMGKD